MERNTPDLIGPLLFLDALTSDSLHLAALFIARQPQDVGPVTVGDASYPAEVLARFDSHCLMRVRFPVPAAPGAAYGWHGTTYPLAAQMGGDLRIAYASCNGEEHGDLERSDAERNLMWARLRRAHEAAPFALLLHGGDQVYADEATLGHPLSENWPERVPRAPSGAALEDLRHHLREGFLRRYLHLYAAPDLAWLAARIPSLMQWDDHDICDGWGSLPDKRTRSAVGQCLFEVARESFLLFQHAARDGDLPPRFGDADGGHLGWQVRLPGVHIIAPDLRGQRTRRQVMGDSGWRFTEEALRAGSGDHVLFMSSVPLLGPRLSLFERAMALVPTMQKYEDDLRDQWQSRAHRASWTRMLKAVRAAGQTRTVTALSGEIHLATRAEMRLAPGRVLHQLVASGVTHRPPPKAWARVLGAVATLGESPLPGHPIRIYPLPGQPTRYTAERNTLTLARRDGAWSACWDLEHAGPTPLLALGTPG